jgi:hypothetical protein
MNGGSGTRRFMARMTPMCASIIGLRALEIWHPDRRLGSILKLGGARSHA